MKQFKNTDPTIIDIMKGKCQKYWVGTDALTLLSFPPGKVSWYFRIIYRRLFYKLFHKKIKHVIVSQNLAFYLEEFGISNFTIKEDTPNYIDFKKKKHNKINILYYWQGNKGNKRFKTWVYGYDLFKYIKEKYKEINFIVVDGSYDMSKIYPIIDGYIRLNRHDGEPRILLECKKYKIPYYNGYNVNECMEFINGISNNNSL